MEANMFRRGFYFSELIPLLLAIAMLAMAVFGLATGRVPSVEPPEFVALVEHARDPGLYWASIGVYLLGGIGLGIFSLRALRGY
jgi:hypothetical protein